MYTYIAIALRVPEPATAREGTQHEPAQPRPWGASTRSRGGAVHQVEGARTHVQDILSCQQPTFQQFTKIN